MDTRYGANPRDAARYDTEELRREFLIEGLFAPGTLAMVYSHVDRMITGSAVPTSSALELAVVAELRAEYFLERRELGIINIGGSGRVSTEAGSFDLGKGDGLYVGRGTKNVRFESTSASEPAKFYFNSCPAHKEYPTTLVTRDQAQANKMGTPETCNARTIRKYFHPEGVKTCQLVMGLTSLESGSVWNTMPCHTHERRMEVYLYFEIPDGLVFHMMGKGDQTRHVVLRNEQAIISPSWSIHSGCGTRNYSFIWGMAGENQTFSDMDAIPLAEMK